MQSTETLRVNSNCVDSVGSRSEYQKRYWAKNKELLMKNRKERGPVHLSQEAKIKHAASIRRWNKEHYESLKQVTKERMKARRRILRLQILEAYGGHCVCCGENIKEFLTVDHVRDNGAEHRRRVGENYYDDIRRNGFPKGEYQILCYNCNCAKRDGYCPHQKQILRVVGL